MYRRTMNRPVRVLGEDKEAWKSVMDVCFKLIDGRRDMRLLLIIDRLWKEQFKGPSLTVQETPFNSRTFTLIDDAFMRMSFQDAHSPVGLMSWHKKFFLRSKDWCMADMSRWAEMVELEWSRGLCGSDDIELVSM